MKTFIIKSSLFLLIILATQAGWTLLYPPKTPERIRYLDQYLANQTDIIYFGDSSVHHVSYLDEDKDAISDMLQRMMPSYSVGKVAGAAYNMDLYLEYIKYILKHETRPKLIIIPVNLRSFSPEWDPRPEYQFEDEKLFVNLAYNPLLFMFYRPAAVLTDLEPITQYEYMNTPVFNGEVQVGKVKDFNNPSYEVDSAENTQKKIVFHYMYKLSKEHRKVQSMLEIARLLKENNIKVIFYITPIDYQTGEKYHGDQFRQRITQNTRLIKTVLTDEGYEVLDLTFGVEAETFNWGRYPKDNFLYPNEHLQEAGRRFVAAQLAQRAKQELNILSATSAQK